MTRSGKVSALSALALSVLQSVPAQPLEAPDLRVVSLNVWHGRRPDAGKIRLAGESRERTRRRFAWQIEQLRALDPDLVFLQEVNPAQRQSARYADALGMEEIHKVANCGLHLGPLEIPTNLNEGLTILARPELGLRRVGSLRLSGDARCADGWGLQTAESRYLLLGGVEVEGSALLLANTHLSVPPRPAPNLERRLSEMVAAGELTGAQRDELLTRLERRRQRQLDEVRRLLAEIVERRPGWDGVILAGDLNALPGSRSVLEIVEAGFRNTATGAGFETWNPEVNVENQAIGRRRSPRLPSFGSEELARLLRAPDRPRQIDYVFVSSELGVERSRLAFDRELEGLFASDHFGLAVDVVLPAASRPPRSRNDNP